MQLCTTAIKITTLTTKWSGDARGGSASSPGK